MINFVLYVGLGTFKIYIFNYGANTEGECYWNCTDRHKIVNFHIQYRVNDDAKDIDGDTPLHIVIEQNR